MKRFSYIVGDVREQPCNGIKLIPHCCNNLGLMGAGVAKALYSKWPDVKTKYLEFCEYKKKNYNKVQLGSLSQVIVDDNTFVINMIGQDGVKVKEDEYGRALNYKNEIPVNYCAIIKCMNNIVTLFKNTENVEIHCPKFGCDLAGGSWQVIEGLIKEIWLPHFPVKVCVLDHSQIPVIF